MDPLMSARTGYTGMSTPNDLLKAMLDARSNFQLSPSQENAALFKNAGQAWRRAHHHGRRNAWMRRHRRGFHGRMGGSNMLFAPGYFQRSGSTLPLAPGAAENVAPATASPLPGEAGIAPANMPRVGPEPAAAGPLTSGTMLGLSGGRMAPPRRYQRGLDPSTDYSAMRQISQANAPGEYVKEGFDPSYRRGVQASISGLGATEKSFIDKLLYKSLGVGDPIKYWEGPNADLGAVWNKYSAWIYSLAQEAEGVLSETAKSKLRQQAQGVFRTMSPLKNSFATGAIPGERDRDRMGTFVKEVRQFKADLEKAKTEYGWAPTDEEAPPPSNLTLPPAPASGGIPTWMLLLGAGVALAGLAAARRSA